MIVHVHVQCSTIQDHQAFTTTSSVHLLNSECCMHLHVQLKLHVQVQYILNSIADHCQHVYCTILCMTVISCCLLCVVVASLTFTVSVCCRIQGNDSMSSINDFKSLTVVNITPLLYNNRINYNNTLLHCLSIQQLC